MPMLSFEITILLAILPPILAAFITWCMLGRRFVVAAAVGALIGVLGPHAVMAAPVVSAAVLGFGAAKLLGVIFPT